MSEFEFITNKKAQFRAIGLLLEIDDLDHEECYAFWESKETKKRGSIGSITSQLYPIPKTKLVVREKGRNEESEKLEFSYDEDFSIKGRSEANDFVVNMSISDDTNFVRKYNTARQMLNKFQCLRK